MINFSNYFIRLFFLLYSQQKFKHLKDPRVYDVYKFICVDEMLSEKEVPDYDKIIAKLASTIVQIKDYSGPVIFEWLRGSKLLRTSKSKRFH